MITRTDCVMYRNDKCSGLRVSTCDGCRFFKNSEQQIESIAAAKKRCASVGVIYGFPNTNEKWLRAFNAKWDAKQKGEAL